MAANSAADQKGGGVTRDHREDREQSPGQAAGLGGVEQQVVVEGHPHISRARQANRPPAETLPPSRDEQECAKPADERERQNERDVDLLEHRAAEGEEHAQRVQEPRRGARAHAFRKPVELPKRQATEDQDEDIDAVNPDKDEPDDGAQDDERAQDADHQRARLPAPGQRRIIRGQPTAISAAGRAPKRRTRNAYSANAALSSSSPKSGHRVSVTNISE